MDREEIDRMLYDYFSKNLTLEEMERVNAWLSEDKGNMDYFKRFRKEYLELRWGIREKLVKTDFESLNSRLKVRFLRRIFMYAASVACVIGVGVSLVLFSFEKELVIETEKVEEMRLSKAKLILSSGETVVLDTTWKQLTESNGALILVGNAGNLHYTDSKTLSSERLFNTIITPRGGEYAVVLADGTKVWLNAESELRYPVAFSDVERRVVLKGEAYFEVEKNDAMPFIVETGEASVKVYGTEFNVNCYQKGRMETVLVEGAVSMIKGEEEVKLQPGQKGICEIGQGGIKVEDVDVSTYIAWMEGYFAFEGECLEQVMEELVRWYDIEVFYTREEVKNECLCAYIKRYKDVESLLHYFEQISDISFDVKGKTVVVN